MPRLAITQDQRRRADLLAGRLVEERRRRNKSQQDLAIDAGVRIDTLRALEQRRTVHPSVFLVVDLVRALGITVEKLVSDD